MFIISNFLNNRKDKLATWRAARNKFENSEEYEFHWQLDRWDQKHPKPVKQWADVKWTIMGGALIFLAISGIVGLGFTVSDNQSKKPKTSQAAKKETPSKNCRDFNKGDYVRIQYGNYVNTNGTIIGGCDYDNDYQVKIDEGTKTDLPQDGTYEPVDVGGRTIGVDSKSNLVIIEKDK